MAKSKPVRLEIAFEGGQTLTVVVDADIADQLDRKLADASVSFSFEAEDGRYTVALGKIAFAKRYARGGSVGFGS